MIKRQQQFKRALALLVLVVLAFTGLGFRLVDLQVLRHDELAKLAQENTQREFWQSPRRGDILDAHGNLLATSVAVKTICADPSLIGNQQAVVARALAPLLQMSESDLYQKLFPRVSKNEKGETVTNGLHYVRLQKNISDETWQKIQTDDEPAFIRARTKKIYRNPTAHFCAICARARFLPSQTSCAFIQTARWRRKCSASPRRMNSRWAIMWFRNFPGATALNSR